jgi:hypothetical protein
MERQVSEPPVVRCPGCNQPMEPQERAWVTDRLVDIRYVCAGCGMETKRTVKEDENAAGLGTTHWRMQAHLPLKHV